MARKISLSQWWNKYGVYVTILIFLLFFAAILYVHFSKPELFEEGLIEIYSDDNPLIHSKKTLHIPSKRSLTVKVKEYVKK